MIDFNELAVIEKQTLTGIADAIRAKVGTTETMLPSEMAAKIASIPSGGGMDLEEILGWYQTTSTRIDFTKILGNDIITFATTFNNSGQICRNNKVVVEVFAPNIRNPPVYAFGNCTALKRVTLYSSGNSNLVFTGCAAMEDLTETGRIASETIRATSLLSGLPQTCVIHCTDADIKYIDGAWTIVERI